MIAGNNRAGRSCDYPHKSLNVAHTAAEKGYGCVLLQAPLNPRCPCPRGRTCSRPDQISLPRVFAFRCCESVHV